MADPVTIAAIVAPPLLGALKNIISPDRTAELRREVLQQQRDNIARLNRQATGVFTPDERKAIEKGNQPTLERVSGSLASRGIGQSPVAGEVIAEAEQAPFVAAQQAASVALGGATNALANTLATLPPDDSFFETLGSISQSVLTLEALDKESPAAGVAAGQAAGAAASGVTPVRGAQGDSLISRTLDNIERGF